MPHLRNPLPSALLPIRDRFAALFQWARDDQNAVVKTDRVHAAIIADQMMSNASELRGYMAICIMKNIMFSSRGWLVIRSRPVWSEWWRALAPPICSTIRLTETTFVSILDALPQMAGRILSCCAGRRSASPARPWRTLMGAFPQLGTRSEKRSNAI